MDHFHVPLEKIIVTYEGVDERFKNYDLRIMNKKRIIKEPYFLYVGNAYPHKNLGTLVAAFRQTKGNTKLVLVGKDDFFYRRLKKEVADDRIIFFGQVTDQELANLYHHAIALVSPSLMEGFGLPVLEALVHGCPVICSDIPVFHEIVGDSAIYFNPVDTDDLRKKLAQVLERKPSPKSVSQLLQRFNWETMAKQTLHLYEDCTRV